MPVSIFNLWSVYLIKCQLCSYVTIVTLHVFCEIHTYINLFLPHGIQRCIDGGFTSNILHFSDPHIITVAPLSGMCDICPREMESCSPIMVLICDQPMLISRSNLYRLAYCLNPSSWDDMEDLCHQGYRDCLSYLAKEGSSMQP